MQYEPCSDCPSSLTAPEAAEDPDGLGCKVWSEPSVDHGPLVEYESHLSFWSTSFSLIFRAKHRLRSWSDRKTHENLVG